MDWGSASPFSVGWWAVVQDDITVNGHLLPRGCMICYREWYGMQPGQPNVGLKLHAENIDSIRTIPFLQHDPEFLPLFARGNALAHLVS